MSTPEVHQLFRESLGAEATEALVRCAVQASKSAQQLVRDAGFAADQARDVLPHIRRADFETRAAGIIVPRVQVVSRMNSRGTSSFVELSTAKATVTALTRSRPPRSLPEAMYRGTLAQRSQLSWHAWLGEENDVGDKLYGCFIYGGKGLELSMASMYFPVPGRPLREIPPLNLLTTHASTVDSESAKATRPTEAAAEATLELKRKVEVSGR